MLKINTIKEKTLHVYEKAPQKRELKSGAHILCPHLTAKIIVGHVQSE